MRAFIRQGDTTSHGGRVLEGSDLFKMDGKAVASVGHKVQCPRCNGIFPILPDLLGRRYPHQINGRDTAVEGMRTACGATLIASQVTGTLDDTGAATPDDGGAIASSPVSAAALSPTPTLCLECLKAAAESGATTVMRE